MTVLPKFINFMYSRWKEVRSKLTPGFTSGKLKLMYPLIQDVCKELLKHLREDGGDGKEREPLTALSTSKVYGSSFSCLVTHSKYLSCIIKFYVTVKLSSCCSPRVTRPYVFLRVRISTISRSVAEEEGGRGEKEKWYCRPRRQSGKGGK
jgi:hypothetical protein